ncbi:hypothetical protein T05_1016, partial [Trichinella murrelli]
LFSCCFFSSFFSKQHHALLIIPEIASRIKATTVVSCKFHFIISNHQCANRLCFLIYAHTLNILCESENEKYIYKILFETKTIRLI